jgi:hypothetical protein
MHGELSMSNGHHVIAWIELKNGHWAAAFISKATRRLRAPAVRLFSSIREARGWVEQEAAALGGVPIAWVDQPQGASCQRHAGKGEVLAVALDDAA